MTAPRVRFWSFLGLAIVVGAAMLASVAAGPTDGRSREASRSIAFRAIGHRVPPRFVGFSIEYWTLSEAMGVRAGHPNPLLASTLKATGSGGPAPLRIGGNSADQTWPAMVPRRPPTARFVIGDPWFSALGETLRRSGSRVALTGNLAAHRPDANAALLRAVARVAPRGAVTSFQVGNEPDMYVRRRVRLLGGGRRRLRSRGFGLAEITSQQRAAVRALRATKIPFALTGPGFARGPWRRRAARYIARVPALEIYTSHSYPLNACRGRRAERRPGELLRGHTTRQAVDLLRPELRAARSAGLPLIVEEGNSIACHGAPGVSDHPYSALWAAGVLFEMAGAGVGAYHFHASGSSYDPFRFRRAQDGWRVHLAPEFVGALIFDHAAPPRATLETVKGTLPEDVAAWATRDRAGVQRILAVNRDPRRATVLRVRVMDRGRARLLRLTTRGGLRVGGRRVKTWRKTPELDLARREDPATVRAGKVVLRLAPASASVLTIAPPAR